MDNTDTKLTFPALFAETLRKYGDHGAYAFVGEKPKSYKEAGREINALTALLEKLGIKPGDKVALLSNNYAQLGPGIFFNNLYGCGSSSDTS